MPKLQSSIISDGNITLVIDNMTYSVARGEGPWNGVIDAIKKGDLDAIIRLLSPKERIIRMGAKGFEIVDGKVLHRGQEINTALSKILFNLIQEGFDVEPYENFLDNLNENPSYRAREQLYTFIEANKITITPDGYLMLYKNVLRVGDTLMDVYTRTIPNPVGATVEMDRALVDDDPNRTCSRGLHVASLPYLQHYSGDVTVLVKVNPADVVSIPVDYHNSKMRVCRYKVEAIHQGGVNKEATPSVLYGSGWDDDDEYEAGQVRSYFDEE